MERRFDHPRYARPGIEPAPAGGCRALFWAPRCHELAVVPVHGPPQVLEPGEHGWWAGDLPGMKPGDRYHLRLDGRRAIPDPLSRCQPLGLHGPSEVVDLDAFPWTDARWSGVRLPELVVYELHIGTFTPEGTLDAAIPRLDALVDLGVTAVELMPVVQCPGERNWGYDGVLLFAVQHSIGGWRALQRFVDACHARGLAVILDTVYNHLGPEGDHLGDLLPIASDAQRTPWGPAINVDGPRSDGVRALLHANARQWIERFHADGLRLDAVHLIPADGAIPFITDLATRVHGWSEDLRRPLHLIAEAGINAPRFVRPREAGGHGLASQWADDFHHALHALVTGETQPPSDDFGTVADLARAFSHGFVYDGRWLESRQQTWGADASDLRTDRFVVFAQNHDQIGNRALGERLSLLTDADGLRLAAAAVILSPYLPLLFMGEEWGERAPFQFFVDHHPSLAEGVRRSRRDQFDAIFGRVEPPDPFAPAVRDACRIDPSLAEREPGRSLRAWYRACLRARRDLPSLHPGSRSGMEVRIPHPAVVAVDRQRGDCRTLLLLNPTGEPARRVPLPEGSWSTRLASCAAVWGGTGWDEGTRRGAIDLPPRAALLLQPRHDP